MRDLLVTLSALAVLAAAGILGKGIYFGIGIARDLHQAAVIDSQRTSNDLVIDYAEEIYIAMLKSGYDNDGKITRDLGQLVEAGYLREIPVNPFTGQPVEHIRIGEFPNAGNLSVVTGWVEAGADDGSDYHKYEGLLFIAYGKPDQGFVKYADRRITTFNDCQLSAPDLPEEIDQSVIYVDGGLGGPGGNVSSGYYVKRPTLEAAMIAEAYTLPIRVVKEPKK